MSDYFDPLEVRDQQQREAQLMAALPGHIAFAKKSSSAFAQILKDVDATKVSSQFCKVVVRSRFKVDSKPF